MRPLGKSTLKWWAGMCLGVSPTTRSRSDGMQIWLDESWSIQNEPPSELPPTLITPIWKEPLPELPMGKTFPYGLELKRLAQAISENAGTSAFSGPAIPPEVKPSLSTIEASNFLEDSSTTKQSFSRLSGLFDWRLIVLLSCVGPAILSPSKVIQMKSSISDSLNCTLVTHLPGESPERLSRDQMFMVMAWTAAMRGTCNRLKVGAVIVRDNRPISLGYNGTPPGHAHCGPECNFDNPCTKTRHAESNALEWAVRDKRKVSTAWSGAEGSTMYVTDSPCVVCAAKIVSAGVKRVVFDREYRDNAGLKFLEREGVEVEQCHVKLVINAN